MAGDMAVERTRDRLIAFAVAMALAMLLSPWLASATADEPADAGPFGPVGGYTFDPISMHDPDDIPQMEQPDWWTSPVFQAYFGSALRPTGAGIESVAVGANPAGARRVFVSTARTNRVYAYDAVTPGQPVGSFGGGSGPAVLSDAAGVAYARGEVFVVDRSRGQPENARVVVYDGAGSYKRSFQLLNPTGIADLTGIDVTAGEVWVTGEFCGGLGGVVEIFDALSGAIKGITVNAAHAPTGDPAHPCDAAWDASSWWDLAVVPELDAAIAQYRLVKRGLLAALATPDPELTCYTCFRRLWQDGIDAVWGMKWLLTVDGDSRTSRGTGVTEYAFEPAVLTGDPFLQERRRWVPKQAGTGGVRDIAYLNRDTRIDWDGLLTTDAWGRATQCIDYVVSDADIYAVGDQGEHWYELARGFTKIELYVDGSLTATNTTPADDFCLPTTGYANGPHSIKLIAYVDGRTVTVENPGARIDNAPPSGTVGGVDQYARDTVTVTGTATDQHAGPRTWELEIQPSGGSWQRLCGPFEQPDPTGTYSCDWNTRQFADGAYKLRGRVVDLSSDGGNVGYTPEVATLVDNTAPNLSATGELRARTAPEVMLESDRPALAIDAQDSPGSGVKSIEVLVDGVRVYYAEQSCAGGACSMSRTYTLNPLEHSNGRRTVRVVVTDHAGHTSATSWPILVNRPGAQAVDTDPEPDSSGPEETYEPFAPDEEAGGNDEFEGWPSAQPADAGLFGPQILNCDAADRDVVGLHVDPGPLAGGAVTAAIGPIPVPAYEAPATGAAIANLLVAGGLPLHAATAFEEEARIGPFRIFSAYQLGDRRAMLLMEDTGGGVVGTDLIGCSQFFAAYDPQDAG